MAMAMATPSERPPEEDNDKVAAFTKKAVDTYNKEARKCGADELNFDPDAEMGIMGTVRLVGGAVVGIAVITLVVNQVLTIDSIANSSGPFSGVITSLETTGTAAMTLLVVGLVVAAAAAIMRFMGSGF